MIPLMDRYQHKIKTLDELRQIIGPLPRKNQVIMCHGVFDVVHPGHIRHLLYAKSKAAILIASLTADNHIVKGPHRPHVPQDLRALNLATYEFVDYVLVDINATPLKSLEALRPDFYAKGYEYLSGPHPNTKDETELVTSYGGQVLFTPGDYVLSSSKLIEQAPPKLRVEKLVSLLSSNGLTFDTLRTTLDNLGQKRVHVVGDTIVDSFTYVNSLGGQAKTPTLSVLFDRRVDYVGGAAVVAEHLAAAGAQVSFSTVLGRDDAAVWVCDELKKAGVEVLPSIDAGRPTTNKNAIIASGYRLLKLDTLDNRSISDIAVQDITDGIRDAKAEALVFSDYRHGIFNKRTLPELFRAIPANTYCAADSQVASRWGNISDFKGFDLITPNEREARFALGDQDSGIRPLASSLYDLAQCKLLILTLGDKGILVCRDKDHEALDSFYVVDSFVDHVVDAVGAGDALLAYSLLTMLATKNDVQAAIIGSLAAACEVEREGNIPIKRDDIHAKINDIEREAKFE